MISWKFIKQALNIFESRDVLQESYYDVIL